MKIKSYSNWYCFVYCIDATEWYIEDFLPLIENDDIYIQYIQDSKSATLEGESIAVNH